MATKTITTFELKDGIHPDIDGLVFRGFQGEADYPVILEIFQAMQTADKIEETYTLEELANSYNNLQRCNLYTDMIFAEVKDEPVGCGRCSWKPEINGDHIYSLVVNLKPDWRGSGIGIAMAKHLQARVLEIARRHPPEAPKYIQMGASNAQPWQTQLILDEGFEPVRYGILMTRPCSLPIETTELPPDLDMRPVKTGELRKIWESANEAFRDHFGAVEPTEEEYQTWVMGPDFHPRLWKLAWDGDKAVGNVLNYILYGENEKFNRKRGYTEGISVRRPWRRQGVARSLLTHSIKMFQEMGMDETCLGVDIQNTNGALELYHSLGYEEIKRYVTYRKELI
jgi:mycothiol synthase